MKETLYPPFLKEIAAKLVAQHGSDFSQVGVVLPANRAKLFLKKYLSQELSKSFIAPRIMVMPELVEWLANSKPSGKLAQLTSLYQIYQGAVKNADSFESFSSWATTVLNDFNDINQHLINDKVLFANLRNVDYVEQWSLRNEHLTKTQQQYVSFWNDLALLYTAWQQAEHAPRSYSQLVRKLAEDPGSGKSQTQGWHLWFVGMTSFTPAEALLVKNLSSLCSVHTIWDADAYYLNNRWNKAGYHIRVFSENDANALKPQSYIAHGARKVELIECTTAIAETIALSKHLQSLSKEQLMQSAIVLADTSLGIPLMKCLPRLDVPINLAFGISLSYTEPGQSIHLLLRIKRDLVRDKVHHHLLSEWISTLSCFGLPNELLERLNRRLHKSTGLFADRKDLVALLSSEEQSRPWSLLMAEISEDDFIARLCALVESILHSIANDWNKTMVSALLFCLQELRAMVNKYPFVQTGEALQLVWKHVAAKEQVSFEGEPTDGLQVLSLAETRALDFENVFVLGANEDVLPGTAQPITYIPWDIRHEYKMPMPDEREAMISYGIYRLMQRASLIHFYYCNVSDDFRSTEPSRFLKQLQAEWPLANPNVSITQQTVRLHETANTGAWVRMPNNDFVKQRLNALFASGISPSAISKYNRCPLDFYYRYVIGLGEAEEKEEQMSASTFGSVVHYVLEKFYMPFKGSCPDDSDFVQLLEKLKPALDEAFEAQNVVNTSTGFNALASDIAAEMLNQFIQMERSILSKRKSQNLVTKIEHVEHNMMRDLPAEKYNWHSPVRIRGKADRIDNTSGQLHIIDYKTGRVNDDDYVLKKDFREIFTSNKYPKLLQLLSYIYLCEGEGYHADNLNAAFYSFANYKAGYTYLDTQGLSMKILVDEFESALMQWVKDLYAVEYFEHNEDSKYCQYCS